MAREILLFWRQGRGGVLMFMSGDTLPQDKPLVLAFGGTPRLDYTIAAVYKPEDPVALIEQYYNVWEPVLDPPQVAEIRAGIQKVRASTDCLAYLLKLEGVHAEDQAPQPQARPVPGPPRNPNNN